MDKPAGQWSLLSSIFSTLGSNEADGSRQKPVVMWSCRRALREAAANMASKNTQIKTIMQTYSANSDICSMCSSIIELCDNYSIIYAILHEHMEKEHAVLYESECTKTAVKGAALTPKDMEGVTKRIEAFVISDPENKLYDNIESMNSIQLAVENMASLLDSKIKYASGETI